MANEQDSDASFSTRPSAEFLRKTAALIEAKEREIRNVKSDLHTQQLIAEVETDRAIAAESERDELRRRLEAPCEEVDAKVFHAFGRDTKGDQREAVVPADYARDLYRKWQEGAEQLAAVRDALTGNDYASLPSDYSVVRMAHTIRADHDKFRDQVINTCKRAESADQRAAEAVQALRAAMEDTPGWYELARAAIRARSEGEGNG